ncbi:TPA: LTA synthase family protein [Streptococcus suis]|nr:LTA synthase family protein [Streptococcus suis]
MKLLKKLISITLTICLCILFINYSNIIQNELSVSQNSGKVRIEANETQQYIDSIQLNGKYISGESVVKNEWYIVTQNVVDTFYISQVEDNVMEFDLSTPVKSIAFEYRVGDKDKHIRVYVDDTLVQTINTSKGDKHKNLAFIRLPTKIQLSKENILWYLQLAILAVGLLFFIVNGTIWRVEKRKFVSLAFLLTIQYFIIEFIYPLFYRERIVIFNSSFNQDELHLLLFTLTTLIFTSFLGYRQIHLPIIHFSKFILNLLSFTSLPLLSLFLIENSYSQFSTLSQENILYNMLIIGLFYLLLSFTFNFRVASLLVLTSSILLGISNQLMIDSRGTPLLFYNIFQIEDGLNIASNVAITFNNRMFQSAILGCILLTYYTYLPKFHFQKRLPCPSIKKIYRLNWLKRSLRLLIGYISFLTLVPLISIAVVKKVNIDLNYWRMYVTYGEYGLPLSLTSFYEDSKLSKPEGYSHSTLESIFEKYPTETIKQEIQPNIIFIQNESQADFSKLKGINLQPNPLANQQSLKDNAVHGSLNVSVYGGGTANTEYEVLTSNPISLLSSNLFPYQQIITQERPSFATYLQNQQYDTVAMHPQSGNNYNRKTVYPFLGFNKSYFLDSEPSIGTLSELTTERNWPSDQFLFNNLKELYSTKGSSPLFSFVVTMQGHGGYLSNENTYPREVSINGSTSNYLAETEFLTSMKHTDEAFAGLISFFSTYKEPTVIVMYGDHQPSLSQEFYSQFMNTDNPSAKYTTPFVIWANFDIPKREKTTISPNYLVPYLMSILSESKYPLPRTGYHQFLEEAQKTLPILTSWGNLDSVGKSIDNIEEIPLYHTYLQLEYNNAVDKRIQLEFFE